MSFSAGKPPHPSSPEAAFAQAATGDEQEFDPEDIRPCPDFEDDHSTTDFDLDAELDRRQAETPTVAAAVAADDCRLHEDAEDIRPCPEHEDDHSTADFDLNAEIEARLGKAEDAPPVSAAPAAAAKEASEPPASLYDQTPFDYYYPEDERPEYDYEDDHSGADFDLSEEIERQAEIRKAERPAPPVDDGTRAEVLYPEYIRPGDDHEDDHSGADVDEQGDAHPPMAESPEKNEEARQAEGMHPDLAASLHSSLSYAQKGAQDSDGGVDAELNADAPELSGDSGSALEPKDSGGGPVPPANESEAKEAVDDAVREVADNPDPDAYVEGLVATEEGSSGSPPPPPGGNDADDGADDDDDEDDEDEEDEKDAEDRPMTLRDHFRDLRKRVFRAFLWMLGGFFVCYPFAEQLFDWLFKPLMKAMPDTSNLIYTSPPEAFFTFLKVSLVSGLFITSPMIFYQVWAFVAPGLYKEEKLYILPVAFFSALFFISGGAFCYFIVFPFAFEFFMSYNKGIIQAMPALKETLSFVLQLLVAFGLVFEMPLFAFFLSRLGIITADMMRRFRRYAVLVMIIVAAVLTPPDVLSQVLMAGPLLVLYEFSILITVIFGKKKPKDEDEEDEDEEHKSPASA